MGPSLTFMSVAFWICAGVTILSSVVSAGYAVAGVRAAEEDARAASEYALSRSIALVAISIVAIFTANSAFLTTAALAMIVVQALDAVIGARSKDRIKTVGPAVTAAVNTAALVWLSAI